MPISHKFLAFFALFACIFFTSCEGMNCGNGVVKDAETGELLSGVFVDVLSGDEEIYTDSTGKFDVCNNIAGCFGGCKPISVEFSKTGYRSIVLEEDKKDIEGDVLLEKL